MVIKIEKMTNSLKSINEEEKEFLLKHDCLKSSLKTRDKLERTILMNEIICDQGPDIIEELIKLGSDVNDIDCFNNAPLNLAATYCSNPEIMKILLKHGADINHKRVSDQTALISACICNKNIGIIKVLIESGIDVNAKDKHGKTALDYAKEFKKKEIIELLKELY